MNDGKGPAGSGAPGESEGAGPAPGTDRRDAPGPGRAWLVVVVLCGGLAGIFGGPLLGVIVYALLPESSRQVARGNSALRLGLIAGPPLGAFLFYQLARRGTLKPPPARRADPGVLGTPVTWVHGALILGGLGLLFLLADSNMGPPKSSSNEIAAMATLRNLVSCQAACQAQFQPSGKIDCDGDGIGEYGTFLELTGSVPVRNGFFPGKPAGSDFSKVGEKVYPPILSPAFASVDARGIVTKQGYCFLIYLPGDSAVAGFVHETGPAATPGLSGRIGVDLSETTWCAYAWPASRGNSGNRCYFVNQSGDVLQSANEVAKWSGMERPMAPDSAFLGGEITSKVAVGTLGQDGDLWRISY